MPKILIVEYCLFTLTLEVLSFLMFFYEIKGVFHNVYYFLNIFHKVIMYHYLEVLHINQLFFLILNK